MHFVVAKRKKKGSTNEQPEIIPCDLAACQFTDGNRVEKAFGCYPCSISFVVESAKRAASGYWIDIEEEVKEISVRSAEMQGVCTFIRSLFLFFITNKAG